MNRRLFVKAGLALTTGAYLAGCTAEEPVEETPGDDDDSAENEMEDEPSHNYTESTDPDLPSREATVDTTVDTYEYLLSEERINQITGTEFELADTTSTGVISGRRDSTIAMYTKDGDTEEIALNIGIVLFDTNDDADNYIEEQGRELKQDADNVEEVDVGDVGYLYEGVGPSGPSEGGMGQKDNVFVNVVGYIERDEAEQLLEEQLEALFESD